MESAQGVPPPAEGETSRWNLESSSAFWTGRLDPWVTGIVFVLGTVLVLAVYFREGRNVGVGHRLLLAGLRLGLLALLLLVILPQLRVWYERQAAPDLVVIFDDSQSMSTVDRYRDPEVQKAADALAKQAGVSEADRLRLAQTMVTRPDPDWLKTLLTQKRRAAARLPLLRPAAPPGRRDQAGGAGRRRGRDPRPQGRAEERLDAARRRRAPGAGEYNASSLAAVVVLTDGVTTEGESLDHAAEYAKDQGVPLFFVGLGDANDVRNIRLHDLQAVDSVYVNDRILFELSLNGVGYPGLTVPVTLKEKGKDAVLDKKEVTLSRRQRGREGPAPVQADRAGRAAPSSSRRRSSPTRPTRRTTASSARSSSARRSSSRCCTSRATGATSTTSSRRCWSARATGPRATRASTSRWCC